MSDDRRTPKGPRSVGAATADQADGGDAEEAGPVHGTLADLRRVLADAAGEHDRVEPVHRGRHGHDEPAQPVQVRIAGEFCAGVSGGRAGQDLPPVRCPGEPVQAGAVLKGSRQFAGGVCTCSSRHSTSPGSTVPDLVAIISPSSGVKPIVVSTDRPPCTLRPDGVPEFAGPLLAVVDLADAGVQRGGELLVHGFGLVAGHAVHAVPVALEQGD